MPAQTWRRFLTLSKEDRSIVLQAAARLVAARVGLRVLGFRVCQRVVAAFGCVHGAHDVRGAEEKSGQACERVERIARMQAAAERNLFFSGGLPGAFADAAMAAAQLWNCRGVANRRTEGSRSIRGACVGGGWRSAD